MAKPGCPAQRGSALSCRQDSRFSHSTNTDEVFGTHRVINEPPMVRITEQRRPDRGTIGRSNADRDYRMSTYDKACLCGRTRRSGSRVLRLQANVPHCSRRLPFALNSPPGPSSLVNSMPAAAHLGRGAQKCGYVCHGPNPSADHDGSGAAKYGERTGDCCEFRLHHFRYPRSRRPKPTRYHPLIPGFLSFTPGSSPLMNSTPALSRAARMA